MLVNITALTMPGGLQLLTKTTTCGPKGWAIPSAAWVTELPIGAASFSGCNIANTAHSV